MAGDLDLMAAEARCEMAPPGPWTFDIEDGSAIGQVNHGVYMVCGGVDEAEGPFIAHARSDLPAALSLLREAVALRRLWRDRQGTSDDEYGAAAESFWKKIEALDLMAGKAAREVSHG